jgi:hypothetical protein
MFIVFKNKEEEEEHEGILYRRAKEKRKKTRHVHFTKTYCERIDG